MIAADWRTLDTLYRLLGIAIKRNDRVAIAAIRNRIDNG